MDLLIAFIIFLISMLASVILNISFIYAVIIGIFCFTSVGLHRGFPLKSMLSMIWDGMKGSFVVLQIFILIGLLTALWRISGTIPCLIYYSIRMINPNLFILITFLSTAFVSYLLGSSYGTAGTIGVVMVILARSGNVNAALVAGAALSGAFFGDRCAPTSSCANLVASVTSTDLTILVRKMLKSVIVPFCLACFIYTLFSLGNPLVIANANVPEQLQQNFNLEWPVVIPAIIILVLPLFKIKVRYTIIYSVISAAFIAYFVQGFSIYEIVKSAILGFSFNGNTELAVIINGGGLLPMLNVSLIVLFSSAYSGIFKGTKMLEGLKLYLEKISRKIRLFPTTLLTSILACIISCNQTLTVMITSQLTESLHLQTGRSREEFAVNLSNSASMIPAFIPWSVACTAPLSMLHSDISALQYAYFLYLVPLCALLFSFVPISKNRKSGIHSIIPD